jgi:putative transposase
LEPRPTDEHIISALRLADSGVPIVEVSRKFGVTETSFFRWSKQFVDTQRIPGVAELRRLKQLEEENRRLKQLVANLTLDKHRLQEVVAKKSVADQEAGASVLSRGRLPGKRTSHPQNVGRSPLGVSLPQRKDPQNALRIWLKLLETAAFAGAIVGCTSWFSGKFGRSITCEFLALTGKKAWTSELSARRNEWPCRVSLPGSDCPK